MAGIFYSFHSIRNNSRNIMQKDILNITNSTQEEIKESNQTVFSIVALEEEYTEYKFSIYILTYMTIPVAIWGWIGNFLSFR